MKTGKDDGNGRCKNLQRPRVAHGKCGRKYLLTNSNALPNKLFRLTSRPPIFVCPKGFFIEADICFLGKLLDSLERLIYRQRTRWIKIYWRYIRSVVKRPRIGSLCKAWKRVESEWRGQQNFLRVLKRKILRPNKFHFSKSFLPRSRHTKRSPKVFSSPIVFECFEEPLFPGRRGKLSAKVYHLPGRLSFDLSIDFSSLIRSKIKKAICKFSGFRSLRKLFFSKFGCLLPATNPVLTHTLTRIRAEKA